MNSTQQWFRFAIVGARRHALVEHDDGYGRMLCGYIGKVDAVGDRKLSGALCGKCRSELSGIGSWAGWTGERAVEERGGDQRIKCKRARKAMRCDG